QIAVAIEGERVGNANAGGNGFELLRADVVFLNRAAFAVDVVMRNAVFDAVGIRIIRDQEAKIQIPAAIGGDRGRIDSAGTDIGGRPAAGDDFLLIRFAVAISV